MSISIDDKITKAEWTHVRKAAYKAIAESVEAGTTVGRLRFDANKIVISWLLKINVDKP